MLLLCLLASLTATAFGQVGAGKNTVLLFSFFRGNGEDGLYLAWSRDGSAWAELKPPGKSFLAPAVGGRLMRDPCLRQGPDGKFHLVWTTSWGRPPVFGYANSKDLIHWSEQRAIPVMESEPAVENVWAPELFFDTAKGQWIVFWASTVPGRFPETAQSGDHNHRIYCTTTKDFTTFAPSRLFYDGGFNVIDATLLPARGKFYLIVKDETKTPVRKHLRIAMGDRPDGPFGPAGPPVAGDWVEGPSAIQVGNEFYIYFDHYAKPQYYGAVKSTDVEHWQNVQVSFPRGARHCTVLMVPETIVHRIQTIQTHTTKQP